MLKTSLYWSSKPPSELIEVAKAYKHTQELRDEEYGLYIALRSKMLLHVVWKTSEEDTAPQNNVINARNYS